MLKLIEQRINRRELVGLFDIFEMAMRGLSGMRVIENQTLVRSAEIQSEMKAVWSMIVRAWYSINLHLHDQGALARFIGKELLGLRHMAYHAIVGLVHQAYLDGQ